jgi:hypothetical protein
MPLSPKALFSVAVPVEMKGLVAWTDWAHIDVPMIVDGSSSAELRFVCSWNWNNIVELIKLE